MFPFPLHHAKNPAHRNAKYINKHHFVATPRLWTHIQTHMHTHTRIRWTILYECLSPRKKTTIEDQWDQQGAFELISVEQETYEKYFYGTEHWNYFTSDEDLGPVILSIKQETLNGRDQFRILVRAGSYTVHGLIPASCVFADRWVRVLVRAQWTNQLRNNFQFADIIAKK